MEESKIVYKIVIIGDLGVGKSCIISRYWKDTFNEESIPTVGCEFNAKTITVDGESIKLQVRDESGQEKHRDIAAGVH